MDTQRKFALFNLIMSILMILMVSYVIFIRPAPLKCAMNSSFETSCDGSDICFGVNKELVNKTEVAMFYKYYDNPKVFSIKVYKLNDTGFFNSTIEEINKVQADRANLTERIEKRKNNTAS